MVFRVIAYMILALIGVAVIFVSVSLLALALSLTLAKWVGAAGAYAIAGAILLVPVLMTALVLMSNGKQAPTIRGTVTNNLTRSLFAAVAREAPWIAALGGAAGVAAAEIFFRHNNRKP